MYPNYFVKNAMHYEWNMKKTNTNKPLIPLHRVQTYLENYFGHMVSRLLILLFTSRVYVRHYAVETNYSPLLPKVTLVTVFFLSYKCYLCQTSLNFK